MIALRKGALGALLFIAIFLFQLAANTDFSVMGNQSDHVATVIKQSYTGAVVGFSARILSAYVLIGFLLGLWAHLLLYPVLGRTQFYFAGHLLLVFLAHGLLYFRAMLLAPQLFSPTWFEAGGVWRAMQNLVCFKATPRMFELCLLFLAAWTGILILVRVFTNRRTQIPGLLFLLIGIGGYAGYRHYANRPISFHDKNVLLIGSDSMRRDYVAQNSNLGRFAKKAVRFENMVTPLARTFPSFVSMLTGRGPNTHRIVHMFPTSQERRLDVPALPRILKNRGYATFVAADFAGDIFSRCDVGFDDRTVPEFNLRVLLQQRLLETHTPLLPYLTSGPWGRWMFPVVDEFAGYHDSDRLSRKAIEKMREFGPRQPFMGLVFFGEAHFPYAPQWPHYKNVRNPNYEGPFKYRKDNRIDRADSLRRQDVEQIQDLYAAAVATSDAHIGRLLDFLKASGLDKKTLVIVFSDHGENIYESNWGMGHGDHLQGPLAQRMLCMIRAPLTPIPPRAIQDYVSGIDIAPTILDLLAMPGDSAMEGRSLRRIMETGRDETPRPVFLETGLWFSATSGAAFQSERYLYPDVSRFCEVDKLDGSQIVVQQSYAPLLVTAKHRAIISGGKKLIYKPLPDGVQWELYDVEADSLEREPLSMDSPQAAALKKALLESFGSSDKLIPYQDRVIYDPLLAY